MNKKPLTVCIALSLAFGFYMLLLPARAITSASISKASMSKASMSKIEYEFLGTPLDAETVEFRVLASPARRALTAAEFFSLLASDVEFQSNFVATLASSPFEAFFWECAPANVATASRRPFEFVLKRTDALTQTEPADFAAFKEHFAHQRPGGPVSFHNLNRDAVLIAPVPERTTDHFYAHVARFVRHAPQHESASFFQQVGRLALARLRPPPHPAAANTAATTSPMWASTSGLGVNYLHVRLDSAPKYYSHRAFRTFAP
jgi:hypothetical protein